MISTSHEDKSFLTKVPPLPLPLLAGDWECEREGVEDAERGRGRVRTCHCAAAILEAVLQRMVEATEVARRKTWPEGSNTHEMSCKIEREERRGC